MKRILTLLALLLASSAASAFSQYAVTWQSLYPASKSMTNLGTGLVCRAESYKSLGRVATIC